jgi:hypothetical protein
MAAALRQVERLDMKALVIGGREVRCNSEGLVSLTDLHHAAEVAGWAIGKMEPKKWTQAPHEKTSGASGRVSISGGPGRQFIDFVAETLKVNAADIMKATRGKGGGTFAHWQIALAYAKYLSPELHMQVNEVYARAKSGDVTLADEIAEKATPEQQEWLAKRVQGKVARGKFTGVLQDHGVGGRGFGDCTNAVYKNILGGTKKDICIANNIPYKASLSLRDVMTVEQLTATAMAEIVSVKRIEKFNIKGNARCEQECDIAARSVAALLC